MLLPFTLHRDKSSKTATYRTFILLLICNLCSLSNASLGTCRTEKTGRVHSAAHPWAIESRWIGRPNHAFALNSFNIVFIRRLLCINARWKLEHKVCIVSRQDSRGLKHRLMEMASPCSCQIRQNRPDTGNIPIAKVGDLKVVSIRRTQHLP